MPGTADEWTLGVAALRGLLISGKRLLDRGIDGVALAAGARSEEWTLGEGSTRGARISGLVRGEYERVSGPDLGEYDRVVLVPPLAWAPAPVERDPPEDDLVARGWLAGERWPEARANIAGGMDNTPRDSKTVASRLRDLSGQPR